MSRLPDAVPIEDLRRALIVKLRHHGDVLLASPVISVLKKRVPGIEIDALVYGETAEMLSLHPGISELHVVDRRWRRTSSFARAAAELGLLRRLAKRRYELLVLLTETWRGVWLARALNVRFAVAPERPDAGRFWRSSFTHLASAPRGRPRHAVEMNLDALRRIGVQPAPDERDLVLNAGEEARRSVQKLLTQHALEAGRFVHIHPASRWLFKCWTTAGWQEIVRRLQGAGWQVVLTAAPDAHELELVDAVQSGAAQPPINLGGKLSLKELAALAAEARLFVGVDSAPMHIAAAMGTPVVALFGPSGEEMWGPWGRPRFGKHRVVASNRHSCRPCGLDGCGGGKVSDCLQTLDPNVLWDVIGNELRTT